MERQKSWHFFASDYPNIPYFSSHTDGFSNCSMAMPPRHVLREHIIKNNASFSICESSGSGMIWRTHTGRGLFHLEIEVENNASTLISVNGMHPERIMDTSPWDAAGLISHKEYAHWNGNTWIYNYANPLDVLDIEIEPQTPDQTVSLCSIHIVPLPTQLPAAGIPSFYLLGDSTVKSYVFEEAPMSSYGQILPKLFDTEHLNVINYSNGGRSLKIMYIEGRLNDLIFQAKKGDFLLIQSGHNDERNDAIEGPSSRYGRGASPDMYETYLRSYILRLANMRGIHLILVTPMTRFASYQPDSYPITDSFVKSGFPDIMRKIGKEESIPVLDLNRKSVAYLNSIGCAASRAITMALEPGESPGKTNGGSYANGNPGNHMDGTHYKEALSKQYARLILEELHERKKEKNPVCQSLYSYLKASVKDALHNNCWDSIFPEVCKDIQKGVSSYYRNQIEKMVQLDLLQKDANGCFNPKHPISTHEFAHALKKMWHLSFLKEDLYTDTLLTREIQASLIFEAYQERFGLLESQRPAYMTEYNGTALSPSDPNFDPNLPQNASQYYPTVPWEALKDTDTIHPSIKDRWKTVYLLGLLRSEDGIERGSVSNGIRLEPKKIVTREKAAKSLYFLWILGHPVKMENHRIDL